MAEGIATRSSRGYRTICLPIEEEDYLRIIHDPKAFGGTLDDGFRQTPELFPVNFASDHNCPVKSRIMATGYNKGYRQFRCFDPKVM